MISGDAFYSWAGRRIVNYSDLGFDATLRRYIELEADGLNIPSWSDFGAPQLQGLSRFIGLKVLILQNQIDANLDALAELPHLEELSFEQAKLSLDLAKFNKLRKLSVKWREGLFANPHLSGVTSLGLWEYKPKSGDLRCLQGFSLLTHLGLVKSGVSTLSGISSFDALKSVELHYMSKLSALPEMRLQALTSFAAEDCKRLTDVSGLSTCLSLESLTLHECGPFASLKFIEKLPSLKKFRFVGTDILDGNLAPLMRLNEVAFTQKRHFSHNLKDFGERAILGDK